MTMQIQEIPLGHLRENPNNPRRHIDPKKLDELAASIREKGIRQPLEVRPIGAKKTPTASTNYEVVFGNRRFKAAQLAGLTAVPAIVRELTDDEAFEIAVTENVQRDDMTALDEARAYQALADRGNTVAAIAARFGKTESHVYRRIKLLQLVDEIQTALDEGRLTLGHAERLARMTPKLQREAFDPNANIVWSSRPLFTGDKDREELGLDDLRPVHDLDFFIQKRMVVKPTDTDVRHFQPELAEEIDGAVREQVEDADVEEEEVEAATEEARASLLELSDDHFVRNSLRVDKSAPAPLGSAKWKEIKGEKNRCAFAQRGVVTHGGPYRVLEVCAKKGCPKHFPVKKKKPAAKSSAATKPAGKPQWQIDQEKREAEQKAWQELFVHVAPALVAHLTKVVKFGAGLVATALRPEWNGSRHAELNALPSLEKAFHVQLTEKTAPVILALSTISAGNRKDFLTSVKPFKFNLGTVEQKLKAAQKKAEKAASAATKTRGKKGKVA